MAHGTGFDSIYRRLAAAWVRHDDLHRRHAPSAELFASRCELDDLRLAAAQARHGIQTRA